MTHGNVRKRKLKSGMLAKWPARHILLIPISLSVIALNVAPTIANTLQIKDIQIVRSLNSKLYTATVDITQATDQAAAVRNAEVFDCLNLMHDQGHSIGLVASAVADLIAVAALMKDGSDELISLHALRPWLMVLRNDLAHAREIVNGAMTQCSGSATVNVKGQNLLNLLSEWDGPVRGLVNRVSEVAPSK